MGFDIGGANTKAAFITTRKGSVENFATASEYFPIWKNPEKLTNKLKKLTREVAKSKRIDLVTVTMTAELSDVYNTKREGVNHILSQTQKTFPNMKILVLDINAKLKTPKEAKAEPLNVAAANWAATGWLISQSQKNCVVIDVGSTSASIIPIINGAIAAEGKTDLEKLICGELVYTGSLRTNVAAIVNVIPMRNCLARVSSELFAQSADVHLILGNITEKDYTVETADGKEKTRKASLARLARIVCADTDTLTEQEMMQIAQFIYKKQVEQITGALIQVRACLQKKGAQNNTAVVTGLGRNFLARKAAEQAGFCNVIDFGELVNKDVARVSTAFAVALMGASQLEGRFVRWMQ